MHFLKTLITLLPDLVLEIIQRLAYALQQTTTKEQIRIGIEDPHFP
jgi:hypothetical protein